MKHRSNKGVTLAELVVAMGIVSVALLAIMGVLIQSTGALNSDRKISTASQLARQVMEAVRAGGHLTIPEGTVTFDGRADHPKVNDFPPDPYPGVKVDEGEFHISVTAERKPPNLKSVTVEVYWDVDKKVALQSYFLP
jgi:type II secretory pathway pseudopilin PulG